MSIIVGEKRNRTENPLPSIEAVISQTVQQVTEKLTPDQKSGSHQAGEPPLTELTQLLINIQSCITHLFELSVLIRRDRPRGRTQPKGTDRWDLDPGPDITNVQDKFPKLKQSAWLAERMGTWIAQHREYIRYRQRHRKKLVQVRGTPIDLDKQSTLYSGQVTTKATSYHDPAIEIQLPTEDIELSLPASIRSSATSFATTAPANIGAGRKIPELTDMWLDGIQLGYDTHVECPYCRTIQRFRDRYQWKYVPP